MKRCFACLLAAGLMAGMATVAPAQDLEELLSEVGEEYARSYTSPFLYGFGPNQNANLYNSASISWAGLSFGVGVKAMGTKLNDEDKTFQRVLKDKDLHDYFPDEFPEGTMGDIVMSGPTIFGNTETDGTVKGYVSGLEVASYDAIPGLVETSFVPLLTPEAYVGGIFGLRGIIRWFPEIDLSEYGKTKYMGLGLQWSPNGLFENPLPVDIMVGVFDQSLDVGDILKSSGTSYHLGVSKSYPAFTVYGGYAKEESDMEIAYTYIDEANGIEESIAFTTEGRQDHRWTLGVTLDILMKLNLEMGHGNMTTYSAGLMFGF
jgi:hypothetical protein